MGNNIHCPPLSSEFQKYYRNEKRKKLIIIFPSEHYIYKKRKSIFKNFIAQKKLLSDILNIIIKHKNIFSNIKNILLLIMSFFWSDEALCLC